MNLRRMLPLLPALAAMTVWYIPALRDFVAAYVGGEDPYRSLCMALTAIQWYSIVSTGLSWRTVGHRLSLPLRIIQAWIIQNAWEYAVLFQVAGNTKLDLYPFQNTVLVEDARILVFVSSLSLLYYYYYYYYYSTYTTIRIRILGWERGFHG